MTSPCLQARVFDKTSFTICIKDVSGPTGADFEWRIGYNDPHTNNVGVYSLRGGTPNIFDKLDCEEILMRLHDEIEQSTAKIETEVEKKAARRDMIKHFNEHRSPAMKAGSAMRASPAMIDAHLSTGNVKGL